MYYGENNVIDVYYNSNTYSNSTKFIYRKIQQNLITKSLVTITNLIRAIPCGKILMLPPV